jgi:LysR family glycine cleavage system transcriptional activator
LLHDEGRQEWSEWLRIAGLDPSHAESGQVFDDEHVLFAAAMSGQGIALVLRNLVEDELQKGLLVPVFDLTTGHGWGYYLVHRPEMADAAKITAFRNFIFQEAAEETKRRAAQIQR